MILITLFCKTSEAQEQIRDPVILLYVAVTGGTLHCVVREDIGKVENVNTDSIEVKDGLIAKRYYYIPKHSIQGFDGDDNLITTMTKKISTTNSQLIIL